MVWNPGNMVPGMPGRPGMSGEPGPNHQSCDIDYSQSREWGPQGCLGHFQEVQRGQNQAQRAQEVYLRLIHNISIMPLPLVKSIEGLSAIGLQYFHCILTQQLIKLWW